MCRDEFLLNKHIKTNINLPKRYILQLQRAEQLS